jgi:RES domain-containing protein
MKTTAWRITLERYAQAAMTGEGARLFGGRWNPVGVPAVYLAEHLSLAILEMVVHFDRTDKIGSFVAVPVTFEQNSVYTVPVASLPENWSALPIPSATQQMGKQWLDKNDHLVMKVPSSVVSIEANYVINPLHKDFKRIEIGRPMALRIDPRIERILWERTS